MERPRTTLREQREGREERLRILLRREPAHVKQQRPLRRNPEPRPRLRRIGARAKSRVPGLSDVDYLAQSMYEPTAFVVPGFPPAMPPVNGPPIGLTDQEILSVIAALQALGGTPTVTMKTTHRYYDGTAAPAGTPPQAAPGKGVQQGVAP